MEIKQLNTIIMKKVYKSNSILSKEVFCNQIGLDMSKISKLERIDVFDAALDNFKVYKFSIYKVILNNKTMQTILIDENE